ncbi:MAG: hypothetical protein ACM34J_01305 [Ignavibacteria bacterium]
MKVSLYSLTGLSLLLLTGCSTTQIGRQYGFKNPDVKIKNDIGYLQVFTYREKEKTDYPDDPVYVAYKGYTIYSKTGDYIEDIKKSFGNLPQVKLKEGEYIVVAELQKNIINSFLVKIEEGKMIEIDSDSVENPLASH